MLLGAYSSVTDYNDLTTPGMYYMGGALRTASNNPGIGSWGAVKVERYGTPGNGYLVQIAITNSGIAYRISSYGDRISSSWNKLATA